MNDIREDFGARQAEMTARWYENVKRLHPDVDAYIATRHLAYLDRWKEAGRFIADDARVLDIGGGNIFPQLVELLKSRGFRYSYLDVDPSCVEGSRSLAEMLGLQNASFGHGYNDSLPFADAEFDAVFSSHCLEHSFDLEKTLHEVNRVLRDGGNLLMAVPFGWESNPEHPYFFGPEEWISYIADAGFHIRVAQIGSEYPEYGHDYFIAAQKISSPSLFRLDPSDYTKAEFQFIPFSNSRLTYAGESVRKDDHIILMGDDWVIDFAPPAGAREVLPILNRHDWSGVVEVAWGAQTTIQDCYSWFPYAQPVRIKAEDANSPSRLRITLHGKNPSSYSAQAVLYGVLFR